MARTFASLALAACGSVDSVSPNADRVTPAVSVKIQKTLGTAGADSVSVGLPLQVHVVASDNAIIAAVVTHVFADGVLIQTDSVQGTETHYDKVVGIPLADVRSGQELRVLVEASDAAGNIGSDDATAIAFEPTIPRLTLIQPQTSAIVGGTLTVSIAINDTTGIRKAGFAAIGSGVNRSDSTVFTSPLPQGDTVKYLLAIPSTATAGGTFTVSLFAENRRGRRATAQPFTVQVRQAGTDAMAPLVSQFVPLRIEARDSIEVTAWDADGLVSVVGFIVRNSASNIVYRSADTLVTPAQQVIRKKAFLAPPSLRAQTLFVTAYAADAAGHTAYAVPNGTTVPQTSEVFGKRDPTLYTYSQTFAMPAGSLGVDIAVDAVRNAVYVSDIRHNELQVWNYGATLSRLAPVAVGSMPWGMTIDNSGSLLLVANSGGTDISRVNLVNRHEQGRLTIADEYVFDVTYTNADNSGGFRFVVSAPIDYSDRPQFIAQTESGALYYSTRPNSSTPGVFRRIDNFLDARTEPRQLWQYGSSLSGHYAVLNADAVSVVKGQNGVADEIRICDHTVGGPPATTTCVQSKTVEGAVAELRSPPVNGNVEAVKDFDANTLALPDTNFLAVAADRRRLLFGQALSGGRAGRVMLMYDPSGTSATGTQFSAPITIANLTNGASDRVFGADINSNSANVGILGVEMLFADSSLRLQGKYRPYGAGGGIAFHPRNVDRFTADSLARVAFVASGDRAIQIVDSYSYQLRGRLPLRDNLHGPLRAALPTRAELAADPMLEVKLFGLTAEGIVVIDVRRADIDNARSP